MATLGYRRVEIIFLAAIVVLLGCGDDGDDGTGAATGPTTTSTSSSASTSSGGSGGAGGGQAGPGGAGGGGGQGGSGGSYVGVDPIEGTPPVALVKDGFFFTEGPCWFASLGVLRFSDIPVEIINEVAAGDVISLWRENSGGSNGLAITPDGKIVACEGLARQVTLSEAAAPAFSVIADTYQGKRFNAPNDAIVRADQNVYFTDPDYGLPADEHEIGFNGVYRITPQGDIELVTDQLQLPNGIALSPDENTLYVVDNGASALWTFPIDADGAVGSGTKLIDTPGGPDGMGVDDAGNLYITTSVGVAVYGADGSSWGQIAVPQVPANCTFGGADRKTLWVTARTGLYKTTLNVPGKP